MTFSLYLGILFDQASLDEYVNAKNVGAEGWHATPLPTVGATPVNDILVHSKILFVIEVQA
jgi:hypothetical protein